jgi:hypothetical protein
MIVDMILADHQAGREIIAVAGNSVQPGDQERADEFARFRGLWQAHTAMMEEVVYPAVGETAGGQGVIGAIRANQRVVGELAEKLAKIEADRDLNRRDEAFSRSWLVDFQRLREVFDHQVALESGHIVGLIMGSLPADRIGDMSRRAAALREHTDDPRGESPSNS